MDGNFHIKKLFWMESHFFMPFDSQRKQNEAWNKNAFNVLN